MYQKLERTFVHEYSITEKRNESMTFILNFTLFNNKIKRKRTRDEKGRECRQY